MDKKVYKRYIEMTKYIINYNKLNIFQKLKFNLLAPIKFKRFKENFKDEYRLLEKSIKKEGK